MRRLLIASATVVLIGSPAMAADMAPPLPPPPVFSWTGFYMGGNVGCGRAAISYLVPARRPLSIFYRRQTPQRVARRWADRFILLLGANIYKGRRLKSPIIQNNGTPFPGAGNNITISQKLDWFATGRLGLGVNIHGVPQVLLYVTGGGAVGRVDGTANTDFPAGQDLSNIRLPASSTRGGWAAGVGSKWSIASNWSVKAEYLHVGLGSTNTVVAQPVPPLPPFTVTYNFNRMGVDIARIGLNYRFGGVAGH